MRWGQLVMGPVLFVGGFGWDALTLDRIDQWLDNAILGSYLLGLAAMIVLDHRARASELPPKVAAWQGWFHVGVHFFMGGLFSAYIVYYFRSSGSWWSMGFLVLLVVLMAANEFLQRWLSTSLLRLVLFLLVAYSFFLFFVPVLTGWLGRGVGVVAALLALLLTAATLWLAQGGPSVVTRPVWVRNGVAWASTLLVLVTLDFFGLIPPVPLSVLHMGAYHEVAADGAETVLTVEKAPWYVPWQPDDSTWNLRPGDRVCVFAPIFAPSGSAPTLYQRWEQWDVKRGWVWTGDRIPSAVRGGRSHGSRHYSCKRNGLKPGAWRVSVETEDGRVVGRHVLELVAGPHPEPVWAEVRWP